MIRPSTWRFTFLRSSFCVSSTPFAGRNKRATVRVQEREDIRFLAEGRFTVKDADGTIYELPEWTN